VFAQFLVRGSLGQISQLSDERPRASRHVATIQKFRDSHHRFQNASFLFVFQELLQKLVVIGQRKPCQVFFCRAADFLTICSLDQLPHERRFVVAGFLFR